MNTSYKIVKMYPNAARGIILSMIGIILSIFIGVYFIGTYMLTMFLSLYLVLCIVNVSKKAYAVKCPSCGNEILFPINQTGCTCRPCQKRLVMSDGIVKVVN
jgi:ribosomal protein S27E